jgi:hypothetical protein
VSFFLSECCKTILSKVVILSTNSRRSIRCLIFNAFIVARLLRMCSIISCEGGLVVFFFVFLDCIDSEPATNLIPSSSSCRCFSDNSPLRLSIWLSLASVSTKFLPCIYFNLSINLLLDSLHNQGWPRISNNADICRWLVGMRSLGRPTKHKRLLSSSMAHLASGASIDSV